MIIAINKTIRLSHLHLFIIYINYIVTLFEFVNCKIHVQNSVMLLYNSHTVITIIYYGFELIILCYDHYIIWEENFSCISSVLSFLLCT